MNEKAAVNLGEISTSLGQRPSSLFGWNDEDDWLARLLFDMRVVNEYNKKQNEAMNGVRN